MECETVFTLVYQIEEPARLLILRKNSHLQGPLARLIHPARLLVFKKFSACTFIWPALLFITLEY